MLVQAWEQAGMGAISDREMEMIMGNLLKLLKEINLYLVAFQTQ
jgi:hypothetical protein